MSATIMAASRVAVRGARGPSTRMYGAEGSTKSGPSGGAPPPAACRRLLGMMGARRSAYCGQQQRSFRLRGSTTEGAAARRGRGAVAVRADKGTMRKVESYDEPELTAEEKLQMDEEAAEMASAYLSDWGDDDEEEEDYGYDEDDEDSWDEGELENPFAAAKVELDMEKMELATDDKGAAEAPMTPKDARRNARANRRNQQKTQVPVHLLPRIAIIGRPNVGKSALFNRLSGTGAAIVYDTPGVTRDRLYVRGFWGEDEFLLIDTGGLIKPSALEVAGIAVDLPDHDEDPGTEESANRIPGLIERQAAAAVDEADAVVIVCDGQGGPCASDDDIVNWMRRKYPNKPAILAINKCESPVQGPLQAADFWQYGMEPIPVSAISGTGTSELLDNLMEVLPKRANLNDAVPVENKPQDEPIKVAILGRPNVGKSSLVNAIVGMERTIVSKMSGTTRDAIDTDFEDNTGQKFTLVDTAGIRKRASVAARKDGPEQKSVKVALKAMQRADVAVLVLDASEGPTEQDFRLADRITEVGCACVMVLNKWDLVPKDSSTMSQYEKNVMGKMRIIDWAPVVFTSAINSSSTSASRVQNVLDAVKQAASEHKRRISTATLNMVVADSVIVRQPPVSGGRKGRIYYATQAAVRPPTFVMFVNEAKLFNETYRRFIIRQLREQVGFQGTPLRLLWRGKTNQRAASSWTKDKGDKKSRRTEGN